MRERSIIGKLGEDLSCEYLKHKGFRIISRNYRAKIGEIDIIGIDRDRTLVFFEVKTIKQSGNAATEKELAGLTPEDNMTKFKIQKVARTCELFISENPKFILEDRGWRIDLIAVTLDSENKPKFKHYENVF